MYRNILVPLDGSPLGERALPTSSVLAKATGARLILVQAIDVAEHPHAGPTVDEGQLVAKRNQAKSYLWGIAGQLRMRGIAVDVSSPVGRPADAILGEIARHQANLTVIATHVRSLPGRWFHGSVAEAVLAHSPVPVLRVRDVGADLSPDSSQVEILVPLDGSPFAEAALPHASALARALDAGMVLVRALEPAQLPALSSGSVGPQVEPAWLIRQERADAEAYLEATARRLEGQGLRARSLVDLGTAASVILEAAHASEIGLVVMATHGRSGVLRLLFGGVATTLLHHGERPLLLVRPSASVTRLTEAALGAREESSSTKPARPERQGC